MSKNKLVLVAVLLGLALAPAAAFAGLMAVGPVVPYNPGPPASGNGYPKYYVDQNGVAVDAQVPPFGDGATAPTIIYTAPDPANQFSVDIGFDAEFFYFYVIPDRTTFDDVIGDNLNIVIGLEAGFAGAGTTTNNLQAVWQRIRINWRQTAPDGFYVFKHPYGEETQTAVGGDLLFTIDTTIAPQNFTSALGNDQFLPGKINQFLFQANPAPTVNPTDPVGFNKPTDWLGDGVTPATFTGSPIGFNKFRLEAYTDSTRSTPLLAFPVGAPTTSFVETDLAVIAGHKYQRPKGKIVPIYELLLLEG